MPKAAKAKKRKWQVVILRDNTLHLTQCILIKCYRWHIKIIIK